MYEEWILWDHFQSQMETNIFFFAVDYVSQLVAAVACAKNDALTVSEFLKRNIFRRFGTPRVLISVERSHFFNRIVKKLLKITTSSTSFQHPITRKRMI